MRGGAVNGSPPFRTDSVTPVTLGTFPVKKASNSGEVGPRAGPRLAVGGGEEWVALAGWLARAAKLFRAP